MNGNTIHPTNTTTTAGGGPGVEAPPRGWREFCELHAIATARQLAGHYQSFARERPQHDVLPPETFSKQFTDLFQQHFCCEVDKDGTPLGQNTCSTGIGSASSTTPVAPLLPSQAVIGRMRSITSLSGVQDYREAGRPSGGAARFNVVSPKVEPVVVSREQEQPLRCAAGNSLSGNPLVHRGSTRSIGSGSQLIRSSSNEEVSGTDRRQVSERYSSDSPNSNPGHAEVTHFSLSQIQQTISRLLKKRPLSPPTSQDLSPSNPNPTNSNSPQNNSDRMGGISSTNEEVSSSSSSSHSSSCLNSEATPPASSFAGVASHFLDHFRLLRSRSMRQRRSEVSGCCKEGQLRYLQVDDTISDSQPRWQRCRLLVRRIRDAQGGGLHRAGSSAPGSYTRRSALTVSLVRHAIYLFIYFLIQRYNTSNGGCLKEERKKERKKMAQKDTLLHLFAGGCSGTVGAIMTCPLEVLKTRLQSSGLTLRPVFQVQLGTLSGTGVIRPGPVTPGLLQVLRSILEKEGPRSLFRGLGPNLVGVAPSRAIYFAAYSKSKEMFNGLFVPNSGVVHMSSAGVAAFVTNSLMNPVWMVKTRMQLEKKARGEKKMNALQCARYVYKTEGIRGFYRGLTASYAGISETMICFLIYETLKKNLAKNQEKGASDFLSLMMAAAFSKGCASCIAYPHEVIRTRLREEGSKYKYFFQTGRLIAVEEGYAAFYRGLIPQLIRQIPNTAIVLSTYELLVHLLGDSK